MDTPLFIVWQDTYDIDCPILNEQHKGIVSTINSLHYFIQQGHELTFLKPTIDLSKLYMGFHFVTEQGILSKTPYPGLDDDSVQRKQLFSEFKLVSQNACVHRDPDLLMSFLKHWWIKHLTEEHKVFDPYLKNQQKIHHHTSRHR